MRRIPSRLAWPIWLAIVWGVVCVLWGCENGKGSGRGTSGSVTPETRLKQYLGLTVPESARSVECCVESAMVGWLHARVDVPLSDLPGLLDQAPLNRLPRPTKDPGILRELLVNAFEIPWWPMSADERVTVSQSTWRKPGKTGDWECTLSLRLDERAERVLLYLRYSEEPVGTPTRE